MAVAKPVTDHESIRGWVEKRDGHPASARARGANSTTGILRMDFPGGAGEERLKPVWWGEWFKEFDPMKLAASLQQETARSETSRFGKLVSRRH